MEPNQILLNPLLIFLLSTIGYCTLFWFVNTLVLHQPPITVIMTSIGAGLGTGMVAYLAK
ncbi:hypothetical protein [Halomicrobium katesii]|uniref:hypothetical protein n=1 Tax=Halomicrobium katesii TaxID=437163 RepID=UPI000376FBF4|nr:hypothetical protein [Halomicrobium katesii]